MLLPLDLLSWLAPAALAQDLGPPAGEPAAPPAVQVKVRVAVDDRREQRLSAPTLQVTTQDGVAPVAFRDDGSLPGDVAGDRIFVARVAILQAESVGLAVTDEGAPLAAFSVPLPSDATEADLALKTRSGDPPLVVDTAAPAVPSAAEAGGTADRITVRLEVDDRALSRLRDPRLLTDQAGVAPVELRDDGRLDGDVANDQIWVGVAQVSRSQYLTLTVEDSGQDVGQLSVFLPSSSEAEVRVQTVEGEEGMRLITEPTGISSTDDPTTGTAVAVPAAVDGGRLAHVLWVGIALFSLAFAYVRTVVASRYLGEVKPLMARLERFLDAQDGGVARAGPAPPDAAPPDAAPPDGPTPPDAPAGSEDAA